MSGETATYGSWLFLPGTPNTKGQLSLLNPMGGGSHSMTVVVGDATRTLNGYLLSDGVATVTIYALNSALAGEAARLVVERERPRCTTHTDCLASPELARACWAARTKPPAPSRAGG